MSDPAEAMKVQYEALTNGAGAAVLRREVIVAEGPDVLTYLQGQMSQDVATLAVGQRTQSFVLQPHGKVDALVFLNRVSESEVWLQVDSGYRTALLDRLERFKLRTKVTFSTPEWKVLGVRGPDSARVTVKGGQAVAADWRSTSGVDVIGQNPEADGVVMVDAEVMDAFRIERGVPHMGRELDERTIPAEAAINDVTISFTKGCYTGQELVARIDSRGGNVPRLLRGLVMEVDEAPPGGAKVLPTAGSGAKPLGVITSAAYSPRFGGAVALAYVRRDGLMATQGFVEWDHGPTPCRIVPLPLVP